MHPLDPSDAILRIRGLSKTYAGGFQALKNVDLDIRRGEIFALLGEMTGLFIFAMLSVWGICRLLKFNREDTITAVFCGSKKSLAHASVMSRVLFANAATTGVILLPTMIYHAMQLVIVSAIAKRLGREETKV